jgi:O-antigen/teichoic acid export membrane protein
MAPENSRNLPNIPHVDGDLKRHSIRGSAITLTAQVVQFALQLGATIVLARLLTPEDYGLFGIVIAVTTFVNLFNNMGLHIATVQSEMLNQQQAGALFWINVFIGLVLAFLTCILAPLVSWFYHEPRLYGMLLAMAVTFVFYALSNQHISLLSRQMRFYAIAFTETAQVIIGVCAGVLAAWYGLGYWALIVMQVVTVITRMSCAYAVLPWRPAITPLAPVRSFIKFGGHLTGVNLLTYLNRNVDNLLIGFYRGVRELGFYDKAYQMVLLPLTQISLPISGIAIPVLSRLQNDWARYRKYYVRIILLNATLGMPLVAFLFVAADQVVPLLLGDQWVPIVPLFRALALAAFVDTFLPAIGWMLASLGQTTSYLRSAGMISAITLAGLFIGVQWGAIGVAIAFSVCRAGIAIPYMIFAFRHSPFHWSEISSILFRPAFAALSAALVLNVLDAWISMSGNLITSLLLAGSTYIALYAALWVLVPGGKGMLAEILQWIAILLEKPAAPLISNVTD